MDIHYIIHLTCAIHPFTKCPWWSPKKARRVFFVAEARGSLRPLACCCRNLGMLQIARTMTWSWAVETMSETMGNHGATI